MPTEELFFNIRLEGSTVFVAPPAPGNGGPNIQAHDLHVPTVVLIEAGLSGWQDDRYRASVVTEYREGDADDQVDDRTFYTEEELCAWLESFIADLQKRKFVMVRYKMNGMPIDWLNRLNLPE